MKMSGTRVTRLPRLKDQSLYDSLPNMNTIKSEEARQGTQRRTGLPTLNTASPRPNTTGNAGGKSSGMESPRMFDEVELTEEELLNLELKNVKNERAVLMNDLNTVKNEYAETGADMQKDDLAKMSKHLEYKKNKFNDVHLEVLEREKYLQKLLNRSKESLLCIPEELQQEQAHISKLRNEMKSLEEDLVEAEAKNRLYTLLCERTRREHMAMEKKVREAREMKEDCLEDHAALTSHMHDMRAAKEESEKKLAQMKAQYQQGKHDWERKLSQRKKEVAELRRRQERENEKEERKMTKVREKEERERKVAATQEMQLEAYELQCAALAPKIEAMEASWNRLRSISGAQTTEEVIDYFFSLRRKEENMRELVSQAEAREARAKTTLGEMLDSRSEMFEGALAGQDGTFEEHQSRIDDAERRMVQAKKRFNRLRNACISADEGVKFLLARLMIALEEPISDELQAILDSGKRGGGKASTPTKPADGGAEGGEQDVEGDVEGDMNRIDDVDFFPTLCDALTQVSERLNKLLVIEEQYKNTEPPEPEPATPAPAVQPAEPEVPQADAEEGEEGKEEEAPAEGVEAKVEEAAVDAPAAEGDEEETKVEDGKEEESGEVEKAEVEGDEGGEEKAGGEEKTEGDEENAESEEKPEGGESEEKAEESGEVEEKESGEAEDKAVEDGLGMKPIVKEIPLEAAPPASGVVEDAPSETSEVIPPEEMEKKMRENEAKLAKGMKRTEWCGPTWIETVSGGPIMPGAEVTRRKKGKKKRDQPQPDLTRILGYAGSDVEEDDSSEEEEEENPDEEWDGFVDRDFIKHRSAKMTYKAQALGHTLK